MEREARSPLRRSEDTHTGLAVPQVEHRELRYFVAVAEELHFTHAAERLEMSQPPLSAAIAQLESKLGTRLFDRDSRNVRLTPAGSALLQRARTILRQVDDAVGAVRDVENGSVGLVRIVTPSISAAVTVPALSRELERTGFEVIVEQLNPGEIPEALLAGDADLGVFIAPAAIQGLELELLRTDLPVAVFDRSHALAGRKRVQVAELAGERLVLWPEGDGPEAYRLVREVFDGAAPTVTILPMLQWGAWIEELATGAFCVLPADAPITGDYATARISGVRATFDTRLAWNAKSPPPSLGALREAAAAVRAARGWS